MIRSALGVVVSVCAFVLAIPSASAEEAATAPKKPVSKKAASKHRTGRTSSKSRTGAKASADKNKTADKADHGKPRHASGYHRVSYAPATPPVQSAGDLAGLNLTRDPLALASNVAFVMDQSTSQVLFEKNSAVALPIASLTKLMTALVVVEAGQNMDEVLEVTTDDIDHEKNTGSRLRIGARMTRANMLHIALMSSENRAASALGRNYPGGLQAFVAAMNAKAKSLGMNDTHYVEPTGLSSHNVASARDLAKLVVAAYQHPLIREYSTDAKYEVDTGGQMLQYINSNRLVMNSDWDIGLQKTGYISEAGRCLVMQTRIEGRPVVMVFLDSKGKYSRLGDAGRIRKWLEEGKSQPLQADAKQS